jgi:hypothetical protein
MAKAAKGITIKCHGVFYYKTEREKGTKPFSMDVRAPSLDFFNETTQKYMGTDDNGNKKFATRSFINVRGQLKRRLLPILLGKKFTDFARVRYVVIDEVLSEDDTNLDLPVTLRSKPQLAALVKQLRAPIDAQDYLDIDELRTDILEFQQDADTFMKDKSRRDKKRSEERSFMDMNDLQDPLPPTPKAKKETAQGIQDL